MARNLLNVRSVLMSSALVVGLSVWACGGSNEPAQDSPGDDNPGGESAGGSSNGGSSNGGSSNGGSSNGGSSNGGSSNGGTGVGGSGGSADWCTDGGCVCSNGRDDDGDGLIDGLDPECTGATDNDEGSFSTGIPGDNRDPNWQDCFFDGNSGAGEDGCRYHTDCLYGTLEPDDPDCVLSQECIDFCQKLTPNGCDCFGCCTVGAGDDAVDVMIGTDCSVANLDDEEACPRCVKTTDCNNDCGECELCPGKTVDDLPDSCTPPPPPDGGTYDGGTPPPPNTCNNGEQVCSPDIPCPGELYCSFGCCIEQVH
jgi:hypothetical protein